MRDVVALCSEIRVCADRWCCGQIACRFQVDSVYRFRTFGVSSVSDLAFSLCMWLLLVAHFAHRLRFAHLALALRISL